MEYFLKNYKDDNFFWNIVRNPDLGIFDHLYDVNDKYDDIIPALDKRGTQTINRLKERCASLLRERYNDKNGVECCFLVNGVKPSKVKLIYNTTKEANTCDHLSVKSTRDSKTVIIRSGSITDLNKELVRLCNNTGVCGKYNIFIGSRNVGDVRIEPEYEDGKFPLFLVFGYVTDKMIDAKNLCFESNWSIEL